MTGECRWSVLRIGLSLAVVVLAATGAEYTSRVRTLSGLRLDFSVPVTSPDLLEGIEIDTAVGIEVLNHHRRPFRPDGSVRLHAAMGLFSTYQSASVGTTDITYIGTTLRAYLGLSFDLGRSGRLELTPHVGVGLSYLDPDDPDLEVQEPGVITEYGLRLAGLVNMGDLDLGVGIAYTFWRNPNRFLTTARQRVEIDVDQDYPSVFVTVGWHF